MLEVQGHPIWQKLKNHFLGEIPTLELQMKISPFSMGAKFCGLWGFLSSSRSLPPLPLFFFPLLSVLCARGECLTFHANYKGNLTRPNDFSFTVELMAIRLGFFLFFFNCSPACL